MPISAKGASHQLMEAQMEQESLWSLIRGRRSIRRYRPQPIARHILDDLLMAAIWAPSAHNRQPWRFCMVTSDAEKERLSRHMGDRWRADLLADGSDPDLVEQRVSISHTRMTTAGALIVVCLSMEDMDVYPDPARNQSEREMTIQSVALACQNLLLAAHSVGLGACWMCAPLFVPELVRDLLYLPSDWEAQALITLGYPAEGHSAAEKEKERAPLESRTLWR